MKQNARNYTLLQRLGALCLAALMAVTMLPTGAVAAESTDGVFGTVTKVADPDTIRRHDEVYGDNTENAGKVTVGKSVSEDPVTISYGNTSKTFTPTGDNFIVTASQTAQVMGLVSEETLPLDVVFVLDTSGSMSASENGQTRTHYMVDAVNDVIADLMEMNTQNRVGVVAFSGHNCGTTAGSETRADNNPAIVLSNLAHYSGNAATDHLKWTTARVGWTNQTCPAIQGQNGVRGAYYGATNIQYGIAEGAKMLLNASNTVERQPFLVVLSDGAPTISFGGDNWKNPSGMWQQGDYSMITYKDPNNKNQGYTPTEGNSFLAMLTAAHYKNEITKKYGEDCTIYTVGLALSAQSNNADANIREAELEMAEMTLNPKEELSNSANMYSALMNEKWAKYAAGENFSIFTGRPVGGGITASQHDGYFDFYATDTQVNRNSLNYVVNNETLYSPAQWYTNARGYTTATRNGQTYVTIPANIDTSIKSLAYNDAYFEASQASQLTSTFQQLLTQIQKQAISSPTKVDPTRGEGFSGYLTYTDPIGEYMEVKKVYGLLADGNYYQGKQFAQYISNWDGAPDDFKQYMITVLRERSNTTSATMTDAQIEAFLKAAAASDYQANYVSDTEFDNSIVWYGNAYTAPGEEDTHVQWMAFADNDSVEYIEQQKAAGKIPDGADYVCRSYFYNGNAGGTTKPNNEYMHFVVRVQRSLTAPYQQTVVISTPASLLSVEEVLITEKTGSNNTKSYTAAVTPAEPSRVIYEVGLRSDINAFTVDEIVGKDTAVVYTDAQDVTKNQTYAQETDHSGALANYDAATGTYTFYTNDWNRKRDGSEHHRAQTHATFDAATDNSFYAYTADTLIYVADGNTYKPYSGSKPSGSGFFYARTVYDWSADNTPTNGVYDAVVRTEYVPITIPSGAPVTQKSDGWYVPAGTYKASSLTGGEDVIKDDNKTETALIISHPHRTEDATNSHYTVLLGNNGKLTLQAEKTKNVDVTKPAREAHDGTKQEATTIQKADGEPVMVGDILTYTVRVLNPKNTVATAKVEDMIPRGTEYVDGSANPAAVLTNGVLTWNNIRVPAATTETAADGTIHNKMGETTVSFRVKVTEAALSGDLDVVTIDNTATVTLNNGYSYTTNTTKNPPEGKKVVDTNGNTITDPVVVPNVLVYRIRWQNDAVNEKGEPVAATVTITDKIPTGTTYHEEYTQPEAVLKDGVLTWTINAAPGASGVVSFRVSVNAAALKDAEGVHYVENNAVITVNNDPRITNTPVVELKTGDLQLSKVVSNITDFNQGIWINDTNPKTFTLDLYEIGDNLTGEYKISRLMSGETTPTEETVIFASGKTSLEIKHNETITIHGLPAGIVILVTEQETGYTATYRVNNSNTTSKTEGRVTIVEGTTPASVEVSNAYEPEAVAFNLKGVKNLDAKMPLGDTTFGFTAERQYADGETANDFAPALITGEAKILSGKNNAEITFTPITIKKAGTYTYLIKETDGNLGGVKYDKTQYKLHLVVEDDGSGKLTITSKTLTKWDPNGSSNNFVAAGDNGAYTDTAITFNNIYEPAETKLSLVGTKAMTGRAAIDKEFSFTVKDSADKTVATGYNTDTDEDGKYDNIVFSPITYKPSDMGNASTKTFTYTVTEDQGGAYGVTYDTTTHTVVVTVTNNGGKLEAYVSSVDGTAYTKDQAYTLSFANTFKPDDVPLTLYGTKILLDGENSNADISSQLKDQQFAFQIEEEGPNNTWTHVTYGNNTDTDSDNVYDDVVFGTIYYDLADVGKTFRYRISEIVPDGPSKDLNMDYEVNCVYVKVAVSLNTSHQLVATATLDDGTAAVTATDIAFTNVKYANSIAVTPVASKTTVQKDSGGNETAFTGSSNFSFDVLELIKDSSGAITTKEIPGGVGQANGNVQFNTITYGNNDLGDHYYIIRETNRGDSYIHGIKYDQTQYVMKVTISRTAAGRLIKEVNYHEYDSTQDFYAGDKVIALTFKNEYHAETYLNVTAVKTLNNGTDFDGKTFGFHMQRVTDASGSTVHATDNAVIEGVSNSSGNVTFGTLYYDESAIAQGSTSDVRYYKIAEVKPNAGYPGVTYDNTVYVIEVTLTDNDQGTMEAKITAIYKNGTKLTTGEAENVVNVTDMANITFNNGYTTQTGTFVEIEATKELEGRSLRAGEFQFELYYVDSTGKEYLVDTAYNTARDTDGIADDIYFYREYAASTPTGNYNYVIKEVTGKLGGVKYNTNNTVGHVTVTIGENTANATLTSDVNYKDNEDIVFTNEYEPLGGTLTIQGKKTLENRNAIAGEFGFDVQKQVGNNWQSVASGTNAADGSIQFTAINFAPADMLNDAGTEYLQTKEGFVFKVVEVQGNAVGVEYTKDYYQLTVKVTTDTDGKLVPTVTKTEYYQWNAQTNAYVKTEWNEQKSLDFTNIYAPQNVAVKLQANKTLNGLSMAQGEYSFVVREGLNNINGEIKATGGNAAAAAGVAAPIDFSQIGYSIDDLDGETDNTKEFYYTIYELPTGQGGVQFSTNHWFAKVTLTDNKQAGKLETKVEYYKKHTLNEEDKISGVPSFTNTYKAEPVTIDIPVDKTLVNKKLEAEEFTFTLTGGNSQLGMTVDDSLENDADGSAKFQLSFEKPGTYEFIVKESVTQPAKADGTYSLDNDVKVTVDVRDDLKGKLHATVTYTDGETSVGGVEFINFYAAPALTENLNAKIGAKKQMNSLVDYSMEGFQFKVTDTTGATIKDAQGKDLIGTSDAEGNITFPNFKFDRAGEYHYWISEVDTEKPGIQIDETRWEVHILVRYNDGTGTEEIKDHAGETVEAGKLYIGANDIQIYKISRAVDDTAVTPVFVNTYNPKGLTLHLTAKKVLNGRELKDREFAFYLMEGDLIAAEGFNDVNGNIRFTVNYDAADIGIHSYKVVEQQGSVPGVIYDTKEYASVSVEVKDDQTKGQLVASVGTTVLADGDTIGTGVTLTNDYIAEGNVAVVKANKVLSGKPMKAEEFAFQLVNTADEKDVHKATNTADGTVTFQFAVNKAGVTTYKLSEVKGTEANMTYDAKTYEVTVTATDDGLGNLIIKVAYDTDDGYAPTFYNTYTPNAVPVKLVGEKVLKGRDMTAGEFKFEVRDSSGALVALGTNDAKGVLTFNEIKFSAVGTYTLTVSETAGTVANVTYDTTKFQVTVEVTNVDGELVAEVTYPTDGVKFVNTYENKEVPDTGDHSNVSLFMILAVVSLGACVALVVLLKKKKQA